jgi:hypothetical protein
MQQHDDEAQRFFDIAVAITRWCTACESGRAAAYLLLQTTRYAERVVELLSGPGFGPGRIRNLEIRRECKYRSEWHKSGARPLL